ncbi:MAG: serine protease [Gemmatimonadales bacterium]
MRPSALLSRSVLALMGLIALGRWSDLDAQDSPTTARVFDSFSNAVVKIEILEAGSSAKAVTGSGFVVSRQGHLITNYHVVSKLIHAPDRYEAVAITADGQTYPLTVLDIDVVHDLAIAQGDLPVAPSFELRPVRIDQGLRLYSLGHPLELGLTIVEGTYNGLLEHTRYDRIHFTGPINPGMSGGPTITGGGQVVGINVATAGNEVSFLIPVDKAIRLTEEALAADYQRPDDFLPVVRRQILAHQDSYLADLLSEQGETVTMGPYRLPTRPAPYFNCWGDASMDSDTPYEIVDHQCMTDDYIFVSSDMESGVVQMWHRLLTTEELNRFRFYSLYSDDFQISDRWFPGSEEEVTSFVCEDRTVRNDHLPLKVVFCIRRYRKLAGLYDAVIKAAVLGQASVGLQTSLILSGVSFENATTLMGRYLEAIQWAD